MDSIGGLSPSNQEPNTTNEPKVSSLPPSAFEDIAHTPSNQNPATFGPITPATNPPVTPMNHTVQTTELPKHHKKGGKGKAVLLMLLVLVLIGGAGAGGFFYGAKVGKEKTLEEVQKQQAAAALAAKSTSGAADSESTEGELTLGELITPTYADEDLKGEVGDQVEANDGLVMMVTSLERDFNTTDVNYKQDTTKELVKVNFLVGNIAKDKTKDIVPNNFRLINSDGTQLTPEVLSGYDGKFDTLKLEPGKQASAAIVYKVTKDEEPLSFVREQRYRIATQNKEVTTKITIALTNN